MLHLITNVLLDPFTALELYQAFPLRTYAYSEGSMPGMLLFVVLPGWGAVLCTWLHTC